MADEEKLSSMFFGVDKSFKKSVSEYIVGGALTVTESNFIDCQDKGDVRYFLVWYYSRLKRSCNDLLDLLSTST